MLSPIPLIPEGPAFFATQALRAGAAPPRRSPRQPTCAADLVARALEILAQESARLGSAQTPHRLEMALTLPATPL